MNFASDNAYGVLPEILDALAEAGRGAVPPYGEDAVTAAMRRRFDLLFQREVAIFPVLTGTAANALALATLVPPHGAVLCHENSHIMVHECGAPEFFTSGAKLIGLAGADAKLTPAILAAALRQMPRGFVHSVQPAAISLSQPTELGTLYTCQEITAIAVLAHDQGLKLHVDGARFGNAVAALGVPPADASWRCGIDVLSFGASKGGALAAEAVVFFDPREAHDFEYRRKKAGHLVSKMRFISAQLTAYIENNLWLDSAANANALAARLGEGLTAHEIALLAPVQTNMVFAALSAKQCERLRAAGAQFYDGLPVGDGRAGTRLVTSFATPEADMTEFLALLDD
ncbi:MAG TPA: beta-eliminating lyase-related protein [Rhizomicrobium sp.]|jgi:threonine aldolase|nr:beta-eliminating lyase-related protein [Rhizomicrobium sp.]